MVFTARILSLVLVLVLSSTATAGAQSLGTFRWQLQPYCNALTLTATQIGESFRLEGFEETCGTARRAAVSGVAFPNADGTIEMGLSIVTSPGGRAIHVDATISLVSLSGTWRDGNLLTGPLVFGASAPGFARPPVEQAVIGWAAGGSIGAVLAVGVNGTREAPLRPVVAQQLGAVGASSFGPGDFLFTPAYMMVTASENWNATAGGAKLELFTTQNGTAEALPRLMISDDGDVGIGTTNPLDRLDVNGDIRVGTSVANGCIKNNNGTGILGVCSSDVRFKRDITPFAPALDAVAKLRPVHYYWRTAEFPHKGFGPDQAYGLVAQDVAAVLPELVSTDADGYQAVDYAKLPLLSLQAIKELKADNDRLSEQNASLERRLSAIEAALRALSTERVPR